MIEADNLSHLMNGHLIFSHQFLYGLVIVLRLEYVFLLVNMQLRVVRFCADILSRDVMLTDECSHLLVCHVIFCLDFFAGVPFCQFWIGVVLDKILVYTCFGYAFLIPYRKNVYVLCFDNTRESGFLELLLSNYLVNCVEWTWFLWLWHLVEMGVLVSFYESIPISLQYEQ